MKIDHFEDLLRALREHPEWLAELRALVFTDELLALPSTLAEVAAVQRSHTETLDRHEEILTGHTVRLVSLEEAMARVEHRLDSAVGYITEERYRNKAYGRLLRQHRPAHPPVARSGARRRVRGNGSSRPARRRRAPGPARR